MIKKTFNFPKSHLHICFKKLFINYITFLREIILHLDIFKYSNRKCSTEGTEKNIFVTQEKKKIYEYRC